MTSITDQLKLLEKHKEELTKKLQEEEEMKRKRNMTIERLEKLNKEQYDSIKTHKSKDNKYRGKYELQQTRIMTYPRFEVILEILKKQEKRISELERIITQRINT